MSLVTTVSTIVAVISPLTSIPMLLWVINFYRLRNCREIASRRPKSSLLAGALCTFGNMVVFPACLIYLNIKDTPYIPWVGTFLQLAIVLAINAPYHIFTFRAYMVYFDIKFNEILADRKWRLYIDPEETNYFLKHRDTWGNQKRVSMILFIHWLLFTLAILFVAGFNGHKANTFTRLLMGINGGDVMVVNIYLYCVFPTFNDTWGIHNEIKLTLRIQFIQQTLYYILVLVLQMDYYTLEFAYTFILCVIGAFLFTWILHSKVFYEFKLPSAPCVGGAYSADRAHFNELHSDIDVITSVSDVASASDEDINRRERTKLTLQQALEDRHGFNEFARHLTKEFAVENLLFFVEILQWEKALMSRKEYAKLGASVWMEIKLPHNAPISRIVHSIQNTKSVSRLGSHIELQRECKTDTDPNESGNGPSPDEYMQAVRLFKKYIPNTAYFALNISAKQRNALYEQFLYSDVGQLHEDDLVDGLKDVQKMDRQTLLHLFDDVRQEAYLLLKYAFVRFRDSPEFAKLSQSIRDSSAV